MEPKLDGGQGPGPRELILREPPQRLQPITTSMSGILMGDARYECEYTAVFGSAFFNTRMVCRFLCVASRREL